MLMGIERLVDLSGVRQNGLTGRTPEQIAEAIHTADLDTLAATDGHFAGVVRDGKTVRLARTIGIPLRYFVAKMFHGPFLIVADRIETLFDWTMQQKIGWQFDPMYTRMVPAHYLLEIDQIGCPDPAPRCHRFFNPPTGQGSTDVAEIGDAYVRAAFISLKNWLAEVPAGEKIGIAFSGGIDSASVLLMAITAMDELGRDPGDIRAFTLDLGNGKDAEQAERFMNDMGLADQWERIQVDPSEVNLEEAIAVIEDYHALDVQCAAVALCLLKAVRARYPEIKYLIDGDGGDENMKSYPLEDSDLTLSSILRNPMLYQEGWGIDAIKHSLTYSGGLSRSYVRTNAPAQKYGFEAFSPYTTRSAIAAAVALPFEQVLNGSVERLYTLKQEVVQAGVLAVTGIDMPASPKRRFQDGAGGETYREWRVSKSWCRQVFLRQWETRLKMAWDLNNDRVSGNDINVPLPTRRVDD
jgi:asparagine synthase (glutamine-hydrolysing)